MKHQPYPEYKDSGFSWLGKIPASWSVDKFRYVFTESNEVNGPTPVGEMLSISGYRGVETKHYDDENQKRSKSQLETYRVVRPGQLAVNTMWLNHAGLGVSALTGHVSPAYRSYWIRPDMNHRYVHHLMRSSIYVDGYTALLSGIRPNSLQMNRPDLMAFPILVPPSEDQRVIADFLDRETAEIDAFIADQERLIELLEERRIATITHAVTKGLDPTVPMKDSGIEWIGRVPDHWNVPKATWIGRIFSSAPTGEPELDKEDRIPFLKVSSLSSTGFKPDPYHWFVTQGQNLERDFIVFPKRGAAIFGNKVNIVTGVVAMDPNLMGWKLNVGHSQLYFAYVLKSLKLEEIADISTVPQINTKHMSDLKLPAPPLEEQRAIVDFLNRETAELDAAIDDAREAIALSRERRAALISAAVTGQVDVSQMQSGAVGEVVVEGVRV